MTLTIIGTILFVVGVASLFVLSLGNFGGRGFIFAIMAFVGAACLAIDLAQFAQEDIYNRLSREVNREMLTVSGKRDFEAKVKMRFEDGKFTGFIVIPNSTHPVE